MTARLFSGKALALAMESDQKVRAEARPRNPALAVILVGDDPASRVYVRNKVRACERTSVRSIEILLPYETTEEAVLAEVARLNADPDVDGILVQLPLPEHADAPKVVAASDPAKDVDGFHTTSAGSLLQGLPGFRPCTPAGVMEILKAAEIDPAGKQALVIGRAMIVGKPMALMLLDADATVTIAHSRTPNLPELCRQADIVVAAAGKADLVKAYMVKEGAVVIDVGTNRLPSGRLVGDVAPDVVDRASVMTPVPGGVGPMTIAMLIENTLLSAERRLGKAH